MEENFLRHAKFRAGDNEGKEFLGRGYVLARPRIILANPGGLGCLKGGANFKIFFHVRSNHVGSSYVTKCGPSTLITCRRGPLCLC